MDIKGKLIEAKLGMNLLNWLTAPRNERNCFKLVGRGLSAYTLGFCINWGNASWH